MRAHPVSHDRAAADAPAATDLAVTEAREPQAPASRRNSLSRALAVLGIVGLLAVPTSWLFYKISAAERQMQHEAQAQVALLTGRLSAPDATPVPLPLLLHNVPLAPPEEGRRIVRDATGRVLSDLGHVEPGPVLAVSVPIMTAAGPLGEVEVVYSSRPLLWNVLGVGALTLVLGAAMALVAVQGYRRGRPDGVAGLSREQRGNGLLSRHAFVDAVRASLVRSGRGHGECSVFHLDIDHFKMINTVVGQTWADSLLDQVAEVVGKRTDELLKEASLPPAVIGAPGGDVLLILVEKLPRSASVTEAFSRGVLDALGEAFEVGPYQLYLSASIGVSHRAGRDVTAERLIREAELAKIFAKGQGAGSYAIHDQAMDAEEGALEAMGQKLRHALANEEFLLYYQPKAHMVTGAITGVEALLRWQPAGQPMVMPDRFVPVLEETGLIVPVGAWVLREACRQVMEWRSRGMPPIHVAVNVSARQLRQRSFVDTVDAVLRETGLEARYLELELTESIFVDHAVDNLRMLTRLAEMGVSLAIDDFGTGHSSLSYLSNFSPRTLKIDRSFLVEAPDGADNCAIARAIIALGHGMGLHVVAEGVETEAQADFLRGYGCDQMQGYLLSRPQPPEKIEPWLRARVQPEPMPWVPEPDARPETALPA